jgi:hypothetical protein
MAAAGGPGFNTLLQMFSRSGSHEEHYLKAQGLTVEQVYNSRYDR